MNAVDDFALITQLNCNQAVMMSFWTLIIIIENYHSLIDNYSKYNYFVLLLNIEYKFDLYNNGKENYGSKAKTAIPCLNLVAGKRSFVEFCRLYEGKNKKDDSLGQF